MLLLTPDVQLAVLTAGGVNEARADWSQQGRDNLTREIESQLKPKGHGFKVADPSRLMAGRVGQVLRLHQAVGQSILSLPLPTKKAGFDWTLGDGSQSLAQTEGAEYALFVHANGNYASGGRMATAIGLSLVGV